MDLETTLDTRFRNESHKALINIFYTSSWLDSLLSPILKGYGLSSPQYNVLRILRGRFPAPATLSQVKERMMDRQSDVSRLVSGLLEKKLVSRVVCPHDRRAVNITITEEGLNLLAALDPAVDEMDRVTEALSLEELQQLNMLLERLRQPHLPDAPAAEESCPQHKEPHAHQ